MKSPEPETPIARTGERDPEPEAARAINLRRDPRTPVLMRVSATSIDPTPDPLTGASYYASSEEDEILNLSRRGLCMRCSRPPGIGTRLLLEFHVQTEPRPVEVIGRTCWTRVEFIPGQVGARAVAAVGIELLGGSRNALDRLDHSLARLRSEEPLPLATSETLR